MAEKKMNIASIARVCGLSDGTVRSIVMRKQKNVALEVAFKLSNGLGVSLERLNGMPEKELQKTDLQLQKIINCYNESDDMGKETIVELAEFIQNKHPNVKKDSFY